jgi:hypothetical protein
VKTIKRYFDDAEIIDHEPYTVVGRDLSDDEAEAALAIAEILVAKVDPKRWAQAQARALLYACCPAIALRERPSTSRKAPVRADRARHRLRIAG